MAEDKKVRKMECKGICTETNKSSADDDVTNSDTDSDWKTPSKLKEEVQTIIDIMGPSLSPKFCYNTSSEADNEESIFSNSKFSSIKFDHRCECNDDSEKTDVPDQSKNEANMSTAADLNTTTLSTTMEDITDPKVNFPYVENVCPTTQFICPPPQFPTNICINSECFCPQVASFLHGRGMPSNYTSNNFGVEVPAATGNMESNGQNDKTGSKLRCTNKESKNAVINWLRTMVSSSHRPIGKDCSCEYYKMNVKRKRGDDNSPPRRVIFELVQGVPKCDQNNTVINYEDQNRYCCSKEKKNIENSKMVDNKVQMDLQNISCTDTRKHCVHDCPKSLKRPIEKSTCCEDGKTRVDVYYFDHGSFNHYRTTDAPPVVTTEAVADKTEKHTTRFWAEIFGTIHIGMSFVTSFILQLLRFFLYSICRPLTIGIIQLVSDYFFKPFLATVFNGVVQPMLIFCFNIAASVRDLCDPISEGIGYFLREAAVLVRAFRFVEVLNENCKHQPDCTGEKKQKKCKTVC